MTLIKAVIFDLDDTLISEKEYIQSGYHHISKILSNKTKKDENVIYNHLMDLLNESPKNVFNRLFETYEIVYTKEDILYLVEEYRDHSPDITLYKDVLFCLNKLKEKDIKLGIITDGYANSQHQKIQALDLTNLFDNIIVTEDLGREFWKPHPKAFEIMKEHFNVDYNEMAYIGDNPTKDFYITNYYPIKTVRVLRKNAVYHQSEYLNGVKENFTITSLDKLDEILKL